MSADDVDQCHSRIGLQVDVPPGGQDRSERPFF